MEPKTLQSFLIALTKPEHIRVTHAHRSNIGNLIFEEGEYVGCEELIDLNKDISLLSEDDYVNIYNLLRRADIIDRISRVITRDDKIELILGLIELYNDNSEATNSAFMIVYKEWLTTKNTTLL